MTLSLRRDQVREDARLVAAVLAGPLSWALHLVSSYALVPTACAEAWKLLLHALSLLLIAAALSGWALAWAVWQRMPPEEPYDIGETRTTRVRFLARAAVLLSAFFGLAVVAGELPNLILGACD